MRAEAQARGVSLDDYLKDVLTRAGNAQNQRPTWAAITHGVKDVPRRDMAALSTNNARLAEAAGPDAIKRFWEMILDSMEDTPQDILDRLPRRCRRRA